MVLLSDTLRAVLREYYRAVRPKTWPFPGSDRLRSVGTPGSYNSCARPIGAGRSSRGDTFGFRRSVVRRDETVPRKALEEAIALASRRGSRYP